MKEKTYIPIMRYNSKDMWYMDITDASLSELIDLREKMMGYNNEAVTTLEREIRIDAGISGVQAKMNRREDQMLKGNMRKRLTSFKKRKRR